jgi:hypothetical protein
MKSNYPNHNCKLYQVIRKNGNWDNWNMSIIAFYNCKDLNEARQKEQYHYVELKATLNSVEPMRLVSIHPKKNESKKDDKLYITYNKSTNCLGLTTYTCQPCAYQTTNKRDYDRHLLTQKHFDGGNIGKKPIKTLDGYSCPICNNTYKSRTSTYTHITKCVVPITLHTINTLPTISESNSFVSNQNYITEVITHNQELTSSNQELRMAMLLLIQQNTDFQNKMLDLCKNSSSS